APAAAEALHADGGDVPACQFGQHARLEAPEPGVEAVERQLARIEGKVERQHPEVNLRILVPREADVPDLALSLRSFERLGDAALREMPDRIVVVDTLVNLPEVEVI